ncbi:winged helix-turn-helix transcriptional regulator [Rhizobium giardinii]|uniref:winged helix-turn-helix transcriptional regulator n=1 Tax=Rhizobium giardinii TaxID=56731 RepID=UPI0003798BF9|nr:response regulator transcription factor [Rhizobium giardinii]
MIIITSSDPQCSLFLRHILVRDGFDTVLAADCDEALSLTKEGLADALLVDWDPACSLALCGMLKATPLTRDVRLIALIEPTAATEYPRFVNAGVDIAFVRPVDPVRFLDILRAQPPLPASGTADLAHHDSLGQAGIVLEPLACRVFRSGRQVHLPLIEFNLLRCLMERPGQVMSRGELIAGAWPKGVFVDLRTVNVHIGHLRRTLNFVPGEDPIRTVRGVGYALNTSGMEATAGKPSGSPKEKRDEHQFSGYRHYQWQRDHG